MLSRALTMEEILKRRRQSTERGKAVRGCLISPGVSTENGKPIVLLQHLEHGRIVERPGLGIFAVNSAYAAKLADVNHCRSTTTKR